MAMQQPARAVGITHTVTGHHRKGAKSTLLPGRFSLAFLAPSSSSSRTVDACLFDTARCNGTIREISLTRFTSMCAPDHTNHHHQHQRLPPSLFLTLSFFVSFVLFLSLCGSSFFFVERGALRTSAELDQAADHALPTLLRGVVQRGVARAAVAHVDVLSPLLLTLDPRHQHAHNLATPPSSLSKCRMSHRDVCRVVLCVVACVVCGRVVACAVLSLYACESASGSLMEKRDGVLALGFPRLSGWLFALRQLVDLSRVRPIPQ